MHRIDNSKFLLFIEPKRTEKSAVPIDDEWTELMERVMKTAPTGTSGYGELDCTGEGGIDVGHKWRGCHIADDGEGGWNFEYLLPGGYITNKLAPHYLRYYRNSIPESEWDKLRDMRKHAINS
jgi:hypothetical protein